MSKATKVEVQQRINEVYELLIGGASKGNIVRHAAEKWAVSERQTETYIKRANEHLAEAAAIRRDTELGKALARLNKLYMQALRVQDYRIALSVQKELNNLLALHAPSQQHVVHSGLENGTPVPIMIVQPPRVIDTDE